MPCADLNSESLDKRVIANGWRQGHILPTDSHACLETLIKQQINQNQVAIVLTHSCDLVRPDPLLPVEIILGRIVNTKPNGGFTFGRSRKELHILATDNTNQCILILKSIDRFKVPLTLLGEYRPTQTITLTGEHQRVVLISWLVASYARPGLPQAFETRISTQRKALSEAAEKLSDVEKIYLQLNSWEDNLPATKNYTINLLFVMEKEKYDDDNQKNNTGEAVNKFLDALKKCDGVQVESDVGDALVPDDDITLYDVRWFRAWERFDFMSLKESSDMN
ncbi:MAG: hypothetical protein AABY83_12905 [Pseudomonadota bacterium]